MAQEDRVVVHVAATQVGDPGQVVHRGHEVVRGAKLRHGLAHCRQLLGARLHRLRRQVFVHRLRGQAGSIGPDGLQQVDIAAQGHAGRLKGRLQQLGHAQAQHLAIDRHHAATGHLCSQPVDVRGGVAGGDLDQFDAAAGQFGFGLHPVAAVGEQDGAVLRHHQRAHAAGEAREPLAALPATGQVLAQVRIGRRHQHGLHALAVQFFAQLGQAQTDGRSAGVHRRG